MRIPLLDQQAPTMLFPFVLHLEDRRWLDSDSMSITFDIPPDVQAGLEGISDLNLRVALYLRHEAQLEALRRQRHSAQAREIVATAVSKAEAEKAAGVDPDKSFAEFRRVHGSIAEQL